MFAGGTIKKILHRAIVMSTKLRIDYLKMSARHGRQPRPRWNPLGGKPEVSAVLITPGVRARLRKT
jgi:hypothetical protein